MGELKNQLSNYLLDTNDANITENKMFCFILQLND